LKFGVIVAFIDVIKAIISLGLVAIILDNFNVLFEHQTLLLYVNALFVIIGHNFPVTMSFKGGKGTASFFGVLLYLDWKFAVLGLIILLIFAFVTNYFVTGTSMLYLSFIMYTTYTFGRAATYIAFLFIFLFIM